MAQSLNKKIVDKREEDDYVFAKKTWNYKKLLKFYFFPILSIIIFVLLLGFAIIPNINYMIDGLEKGKELKADSEDLDRRISVLESLKSREEENLQILNKVNALIPSEQSEVVKFRQKVAGLAAGQGLDAESLQAGENIIDEEDLNISTQNSQLIEIPSKFSFSGNFDSFRQLFINLYQGDDFFIITSMNLDVDGTTSSSNRWKGRFDLTKYQFSNTPTDEEYSFISENEQVNQEVLRFIEQNFGY